MVLELKSRPGGKFCDIMQHAGVGDTGNFLDRQVHRFPPEGRNRYILRWPDFVSPILAEEIGENPYCSGNRKSFDAFAPISVISHITLSSDPQVHFVISFDTSSFGKKNGRDQMALFRCQEITELPCRGWNVRYRSISKAQNQSIGCRAPQVRSRERPNPKILACCPPGNFCIADTIP